MKPEPGPVDDDRERSIRSAAFRKLTAGLSRRPPPQGSIRRLWSLGGLNARVAVAYLGQWTRGWFLHEDERKKAAVETRLKVAMTLLGGMGYLRGAAMKVGQMLAGLPDVAPDELVETLSALHFQAPPMHFSLLREHVENELGRSPQALFEDFEPEAFAAASLGQVHRARLKTGERVAIKIQYPGIARTIRTDLRNLKILLFPARLSKDWDNLEAQFDEIARVLSAEADYVQEADYLKAAWPLFSDRDGIRVPRVHAEFSTKRVLAMEYLDGLNIDDFLATRPSASVRNAFGEKMSRAMLRLFHRGRLIHGDPHPGNFLFFPDGTLGLVDFGCLRRIGDADLEFARLGEIYVRDGSGAALDRLSRCALDFSEAEAKANPESVGAYGRLADWAAEPVRGAGPFDFGNPEHIRRGARLIADNARRRRVRQPPIGVFYGRGVFELRALLYRLKAQVDMKRIHAEEAGNSTWFAPR